MPTNVKHDQPGFLVWLMFFNGFCYISPYIYIFEMRLMPPWIFEQFQIFKIAAGQLPYCTQCYILLYYIQMQFLSLHIYVRLPAAMAIYTPLIDMTPSDPDTRVLHGPGLGPRAGPARSPWTGPGQASMIFCGPGRVRAWNLQARAGPGLVCNYFAGCGPGLGLTFPGLGRARAYSESHSCFNIMVKD